METSSVRTISDRENPIKAPGGDEVAEEEEVQRLAAEAESAVDAEPEEDA